jgi:predicted phosphoribosyltransferase
MIFHDRAEAGWQLAARSRFENAKPLVLALPRGGVPVGSEIARVLGAPAEVSIPCDAGLLEGILQIPAAPHGLVVIAQGSGGKRNQRVARELRGAGIASLLLDLLTADEEREDLARIPAEHRLVVVPRAAHLAEEPGALDTVARLAAGWFTQHLVLGESEARV